MSWFDTPEAQTNPHYWAATLAGHALLGLAAGVVAGSLAAPLVALLAPLAYCLFWEGSQYILSSRKRSLLFDCFLDGAGFCMGTIAGWAAWDNDLHLFAGSAAALSAITVAGAWRRSRG